jgi:hypothetical protein
MEVRSIAQFLGYWDSLRVRARRAAAGIPPDRIGRSPRAGAFTPTSFVIWRRSSDTCTPGM